MNLQETQTRIDRPTPRGNAYSITYWQDEQGKPAPRSSATGAEIVEYDSDDRPVYRSHIKKRSLRASAEIS